MTVSVRFAPSPTGWLHVGNVRAALLNWLFARRHGGTFMLRLDDTDQDRSRPEFAAGIEEDLSWLGLAWDDFARQSDRATRYAEAMAQLIDAGRLYPCYETPEELELKRKTRSMRGLPPIYDRAALDLTADDRAKLEAQGRRPHWRFKLDRRDIVWDDLIRGQVRMPGDAVSDPVLVRADGVFLYTFGSVVDDVDFGITHVIRGEDHVTNTSVQIQIFEALGATPPAFAHFTLFTDIAGHGFSKREGSLSVRSLREEGIEALALASYLAKLGSSDPIEPRTSMDDLVAEFDLSKFHRGGSPKFDVDELKRLNARLLHALPFQAVRDRLPSDVDESFWVSVRPNLERLSDVEDWRRIAHGPVQPLIDDREFTGQAAALLPDEPYDAGTFKAWADAVKIATGRKGKELFLPLRRALTGMDHGPEMATLLPLIGRDRALRRLGGEAA